VRRSCNTIAYLFTKRSTTVRQYATGRAASVQITTLSCFSSSRVAVLCVPYDATQHTALLTTTCTILLLYVTANTTVNSAADRAGYPPIAYEFVSQACALYEDEITDSRAQVKALTALVGALTACTQFAASDRDTLSTKTAQYAAKLIKKPDQCRYEQQVCTFVECQSSVLCVAYMCFNFQFQFMCS
jgi:Vacuolar protein sorting-associated protein 35